MDGVSPGKQFLAARKQDACQIFESDLPALPRRAVACLAAAMRLNRTPLLDLEKGEPYVCRQQQGQAATIMRTP